MNASQQSLSSIASIAYNGKRLSKQCLSGNLRRDTSALKGMRGSVLVRAEAGVTNQSKVQYDGIYGKWTIESEDVKEVWMYRYGITGSALAAFVLALPSLLPFFPQLEEFIREVQNPVAILGSLSMGASLYLIHVYVTPLKRFVQVLWAIGLLAGISFMVTQVERSLAAFIVLVQYVAAIAKIMLKDTPIVSYVATHPSAIWGVGFLFASVTGVSVKEGLCYGKLEAAVLAVTTPTLCLTHLFSSGLQPGDHPVLLYPWLLALMVFAARKYTQEVKDDIGDKSVFMLQAVPEEEREAWLKKRVEEGLYQPPQRWNDDGTSL